MNDLTVTIIQTELAWQDTEANLRHFDEKIASVNQPTDIIILPEMFNTSFTMNAELCAEPPDGQTTQWLKEKVREKNCVITGSVLTQEGKHYYNRLIWMMPDGFYHTYDKRHLFRLANEHHHFTAGKEKIITELNGWGILPLICYDLRFPVWSKNTFDAKHNSYEYDCLLYVANWPERRNHAWKSLLIARAIENQCYVVGLNRTGADGNGVVHSGDSMIINPEGQVLSTTLPNTESVETINLPYEALINTRRHFNIGHDWDDFTINT